MPPPIEFFPQRGEVTDLIRSRDWSQTALGPPETWPSSLRTVLQVMLSSRYAMWLGWGKDLNFFYNDEYAKQTLGKKHPWALGRPASAVWAEIWPDIGPRIAHVLSTGEATWDQGLLLFLERNGYSEETYHTFSYSTAPGDSPGEVGGLFCVVIEETERVIGERRIALLQDFATRLGPANTEGEVLSLLEQCLAPSRDVPFGLAYLFDSEGRTAHCAARVNFRGDHPAAPEQLPIDSALWPLRPILDWSAPLLVDLPAGQDWPTGRWERPPTQALVLPIAQPGQERAVGVFIAGLNPHRPLDRSARSFVELFVGQLEAGLSNARAYQEERRRADALAELDRAKTTFFSNVSHEFRTPLTLMLGPTEDALGSPDRTLRGPDLEIVHRNELRMLKLVNTLLDFARLESGRTEPAFENTDLVALTGELTSSFRSAVERAGLAFTVKLEPSDQPTYVDHDMWEKIVLNLLSNALKFTFEGEIAVELRTVGGRAELTVRDTGVGIAPSELPRLFERFHRIAGSRARTHEGSGIGLALVQDLVKLHGGAIRVASNLGEGAAFTVSLPTGSAHLPAERLRAGSSTASSRAAYLSEALRWTSDASIAPPPPPTEADGEGRRARVLVAEDNADLRDYIGRLLGERWEVESWSDGAAALEAIRRAPPALVLSDVMMPGLDGFELIRRLREDTALRSIPVILLSARAGEEAAAEGLSAGADDYLVKPFAARDLVLRVASRLATAQARREADLIKENLYRHFLQAPFPVAVFRGPTHLVEMANPAILDAWGKTRAEALGKPLIEALPELHGQLFLTYLDQVFRSGVAYEGHAEPVRLRNGPKQAEQEFFFSFVYAPLLDAHGVTEGVLVSAFDVTPQVRSRQEIERARDEAEDLAKRLSATTERLRAAQKVAGIGIFEWDLTDDRLYWSPELYALMGLAPGSVAPSPEALTERLFDEQDREVGWGLFREAMTARRPSYEVELRMPQPSGQTRWVRLTTELTYDESGRAVRLLGAAVDVQLLKEAAAARTRALAEAERINRAKDEFLATMSHELRTPLNAMLVWAKLLRQNHSDPKKLEHGLEVIERNAEAQARLISDVLDVSRIISGKLRLTLQRVTLADVVRAASDAVALSAEAKGLSLDLQLARDAGALLGDPDRLQQIVWNLLSNAIKFTPTGGRVMVQVERRDSSLELRVSDTGAGLSPEHLSVIFERFHQVDGSSTRAHGGLGLGLAIVRSLTEAHGGTVHATSEGPGRGATFTASFPLHALSADSPRLEPAASGGLAAAPLTGTRILVVDDDRDSLDLLRIVLEGAGAEVWASGSPTDALVDCGAQSFDLVLSDIGMPGMDGYAFLSQLRRQRARIPAVALTAYASREDAQRAQAAGFQRHLAKPIDAAQLVSALEDLLRSPAN